ncbi:MAG TPA: site-2 protease family protein [bacterium (Candidatus Stahlbacteria)]|nr:site-2 protease family protein [Candidatus Stahlbacteria bacterium]
MIRTAWHIGKIHGIDINIDPSWLIIFSLVIFTLGGAYFPYQYPGWSNWLYWIIGIITSVLFFASVLGHELSHSLIAMRQGNKVRSITLFMFGGVAQIAEEPDNPRKEFVMAIMGPVSSLAIALVSFMVWVSLKGISEPIGAVARYLVIINVILAVFNLIPGFPLDGGRVLRAVIWSINKDFKIATRIASKVGQFIAVIFILFGILQIFRGLWLNGFWFVFIGWFLHSAAVRGYRQVIVREMLGDLRAADLMTRDFETIPSNLTVQQLVEQYVLKKRENAFIVVDDGKFQGIISLEDIKDIPRDRWELTSVGEAMTPKEQLDPLSPEDDGTKVLARLNTENVHELLVIDRGKLVGIICHSDVIRVLHLRMELGI